MRHIAMLLAVGLLCGTAADAGAIPAASKDRAARLDAWRVELDAAARARDAERWEEAARLYGAVVREAREAGDEGLLAARAVDGLADTCRERDRLDEARELYRSAASMWERLLGSDQPRLATTLHHLGLVEWRLAQREDASRDLSRALEIFEAAFGADSAEALNTRRALERLDEDYDPATAGTTGTR